MKIKVSVEFSSKLANQVEYIAQDKPKPARNFKNDILKKVRSISDMPYKNRQSIYFEDINIREFVFKGYKIVYRIKPEEFVIEVFGFIKFQEKIID